MGCVGSKGQQDPSSKGVVNDDSQNQTQTTHYVKDPTTGTKAVSEYRGGIITARLYSVAKSKILICK
jgi:hypothetical protein